jgi:HK97 family phage portal protein
VFLTSLFQAATPENPRFSLNDPAAVDMFLSGGGGKTSSGVAVNGELALAHAPWWRGINLISSDVGKLPLITYQREGEGKVRAKDHPAYRLLRRKPCSWLPAFQFKRLLTSHALSRGNGYAYIFRNGDNSPYDIVPLDPDVTTPVRANSVTYYTTKVNGEDRKLLARDVLHIKGLGYDGLVGYSVWGKAKESLGLGIGTRKYASVFFKNNSRPNIALEMPGNLGDKEMKELRASWERMQGGLDEAHRVALLKGGMKIHEFSINARDAQLLELRQFEIREIANFLGGVPPHKLGDTTRTAYASLEQENLSYLGECLDPWLVVWEEECWDKLLTEEEKDSDTVFVEFLREALIRSSMADQAAFYRTALAGQPWMKVNEVRSKMNMDPVEGGDEIKEPLNMGKGGAANESADPNKPGAAVDPLVLQSAARQGIEEAVARVVRRIGIQADKAAKKPESFLAFVNGLRAANLGPVAEILRAPVAFARAVSGDADLDAEQTARWMLEGFASELLVSSEVKADKLAESVADWEARANTHWPDAVSRDLLEE